MDIIDISLPIFPDMVVWPGAPKTEFSCRRSMKRGDRSNNSNLAMNCHSGTHVDAPLHFVEEGIRVEEMALQDMIGECFVMDLFHKRDLPGITKEDLESRWPKEKIKRLLIKTPNSKHWKDGSREFRKDFCALKEEATRWLLEKEIRLVGIDYLSVQCFGDSPIVHQLLLEAEVVVIEGLNLSQVKEGFYELVCLPLKLEGLEGAPARVILRRENEE